MACHQSLGLPAWVSGSRGICTPGTKSTAPDPASAPSQGYTLASAISLSKSSSSPLPPVSVSAPTPPASYPAVACSPSLEVGVPFYTPLSVPPQCHRKLPRDSHLSS